MIQMAKIWRRHFHYFPAANT